MFTAGIFPFKENSHGRTGNRTRNLMISSQKLWPLDHEAGQSRKYNAAYIAIIYLYNFYEVESHENLKYFKGFMWQP
jgi:hypothetical protein